MIATLGQILLFLAIFCQLILFFFKTMRSNWFLRNYSQLTILQITSTFLISTSFFMLIWGFVDHQYQIIAVYQNSDNNMDLASLVMATWAGREGVLLLWATLTSIFTTGVFIYLKREAHDPVISRALSILLFMTLLVSLFNIAGGSSPFAQGPSHSNGLGLAPSLRSVWQQIHPPLAFMAYAIFVFPYALGIAGLIGLKNGQEIPPKVKSLGRSFMLLGWQFLTILIVAGSIWAYEANWNGFWAWDPIEVASLVMWLLVTLYFHLSAVADDSHPIKIAGLTFGWIGVTFASFVVRSGLWSGFHAYIGIEKAIVFGSLLFLSVLAVILAVWIGNQQIIPDVVYLFRENPKLPHILTWWVLIAGILINVVGLIIQMLNLQFLGNPQIPYLYYVSFNGAVFLTLLVLLFYCDISAVLGNNQVRAAIVGLGIVISGALLSFQLVPHFLLFLLGSIAGGILLAQLFSVIINMTRKTSTKRLRTQLIHLGIMLLILPYFFVDYGSNTVDLEIDANDPAEVDEFDITVVVRRDLSTWPINFIVDVVDASNREYTIFLKQGYHKGEYWTRGDWISQPERDIYFHLQEFEVSIIIDESDLIPIQITEKPYPILFRISFWFQTTMLALLVIILVFSKSPALSQPRQNNTSS